MSREEEIFDAAYEAGKSDGIKQGYAAGHEQGIKEGVAAFAELHEKLLRDAMDEKLYMEARLYLVGLLKDVFGANVTTKVEYENE